MSGSIGRAAAGFLAAALSVLVVHQSIVFVLASYGLARSQPWSAQPLGYGIAPWLPVLANHVFWGGLWGVLFAFVQQHLPSTMMWLKGLIFGLLIVVFSNWILLPLIQQYVFGYPPQALFAGFNPTRLMVSALILGGFGLGLGVIYDLFATMIPRHRA